MTCSSTCDIDILSHYPNNQCLCEVRNLSHLSVAVITASCILKDIGHRSKVVLIQEQAEFAEFAALLHLAGVCHNGDELRDLQSGLQPPCCR